MAVDESVRLRLRQWFLEHMDSELADAIMASMPAVGWTELATRDDFSDLELRLRAHVELQAASSTRTVVATTIGAAMANFAVLVTALNAG